MPDDATTPDGPDDGDGPPEELPPTAQEHERRRVRSALRLFAGSVVVAVVIAAAAGVAGADGRAGLLTLLWVAALGSAVAGLRLGLLLVVDEFRGRPTSLRRGGWLLGFFATTAVLMAMVVGVGTGTS